MILTEWNTEDAIAVAREEGLEEGLEKGIEQGLEEGLEKGRAEGGTSAKIEIARNLLANGFPHEVIHKNTGLNLEEIEKLSNQK